jgi:hypothetical protein
MNIEQLGDIKPIHKIEERNSITTCYLPRHVVINANSPTAKVNVFDVSCKISPGISLNDMLMKGQVH